MKVRNISVLLLAIIGLCLTSCNQEAKTDNETEAQYDQKEYSPYVLDYNPPPLPNTEDIPLFGDTHLHTSYSPDAGMIGNILGPEDAYRFAKGESVTSSLGVTARLKRPLDFLVVADHAEGLVFRPPN